MGHIINDMAGYEFLNSKVEELYGGNISREQVEEILFKIVPKDIDGKHLVNLVIKDVGRDTGVFRAESESLIVSIDKLNKWLDFNALDLSKYYNDGDILLLKAYLTLYVLTHETEHACQYLIGEGKIDAPCVMLQQGYKSLFDLMKKPNYVLPHPIKQTRRTISLVRYYRKPNEYLLERNAQFDSLSLLLEIAFNNGHDNIYGILEKMKNTFAIAGYTENCDGTLVNTFKDIYMRDKLDTFCHDYEDMDMITRYRFGLPVDENTRGRILNLKR